MNSGDTIVSLSTPMGLGAISLIRCSGCQTNKIIETFFSKKFLPNEANYLKFKKSDQVLDDVIAIFYKSPKSYTGEDMLEIMCHGGSVVYQMLIREILTIDGCRLARPGEFSERSYTNNKMGIFEAESLCALINAKTESAALAAREALSGKFSQDVFEIDKMILDTRVQVEALLDFSDEDIETEGQEEINDFIEGSKKKIRELVSKLQNNRLLYETSKVAVLGMPNSGKSSLINFLTDEDVSIVNEQAGTTRDVVSKIFSLDGMPVTIFDTAGIRETDDSIEKEGSIKAMRQAKEVNLVIYLYDISIGIIEDDLSILRELKRENIKVLVVANKIDLTKQNKADYKSFAEATELFISIKENKNLDDMKKLLIDQLKKVISESTSGQYHAYHLRCLSAALQEMDSLNVNLNELELVAEKLKSVQNHISEILENKDDDRVLSGIFSNFCIGK